MTYDDQYAFLRPDPPTDPVAMFTTRILPFDRDKLWHLLVLATCPIVCKGVRNDEEDWHSLCEERATQALILLTGDAP